MKLPFSITPDIRASLTDKIADGIRSAIQSGRCRPGDRLPGTRAIAKSLGISVRAPTEAFRRLADEGLLEVRTKSGAVVRERGARAWKGHVLVVLPDGEFNYFQNVFTGRFATVLANAGYLTSIVNSPRGHGGHHDVSALRVALAGSVDFALCVRRERDAMSAIAEGGVPFAVVTERRVRSCPHGCVAFVLNDMTKAVADFVAHCRRAGVKRVVVVCKSIEDDHFTRALRNGGVAVDRMVVQPRTAGGREFRIENIQRAVVERFERLFADEGRKWLPDLLFFSDDHAATSGVITLLSHGVRIPRDVRIASVTNKGLGPVMPVPLTAIELSAVAAADDIAAATLEYLSSGKFPSGTCITRQYKIGGTFA